MANPFAIQNTPVSPTQATAAAPVYATAAPSASYNDVDFDSDVPISALESFPKMRKDEVTRIAIILFSPPKEQGRHPSPRFKHVQYFNKFYGQGDTRNIWKFLAPTANVELMRACIQTFGEFKTGFGGIVFHYDTDPYGRPIENGPHKDGYRLEALTFNSTTWEHLKGLHCTWGLHTRDLIVTCTKGDNFQEKSFQPAPESIWLTRVPEEIRNEIIATAMDLYNGPLNQKLGTVKSDAEIMEILTQVNAPAVAATPANNPFKAGNTFAMTPSTAAPGLAPPLGLGRALPGTGIGGAKSAVFSDLVASQTQAVDPVKVAEPTTTATPEVAA